MTRKDIFNFNFFHYGEYFTGSFRGVRYRLGREPLEFVAMSPPEVKKDASLRVWVWPEPFALEHTPEEKVQMRDFSFDEEGLAQAVDWINDSRNTI